MAKRRSKVNKKPTFHMHNRLEKLRKDVNLNQAMIAELVGVSLTSYGRYERGDRPIPADVLARIADYHHVTTDYLLYRTDIKAQSKYEKDSYAVYMETLMVAEKKRK